MQNEESTVKFGTTTPTKADGSLHAMKDHVMTVLGPVDPAAVGKTSMHEHLFVDCATAWWEPETAGDPEFAESKLRPDQGGIARWNTFANADNLVLSPADYDLVRDEVADFKSAGGGCLVDLSNFGLDPQPELLAQVSTEIGINIVAGCGFYVRRSHPEWLDDMSVGDITDRLIAEIDGGFGDTGIRPGIIGEIGTSEELHPVESRVIEAAAIAGSQMGLAVNIHTHPPRLEVVMEIIDTMCDAGLDPSRIYLSHLDEIPEVEYLRAVMERGVVVGYDGFGQDFYYAPKWKGKSDNERIEMVARLVAEGFESQLVLSQDVCMKCMLKRFGGWGYDHVLARVVPRMVEAFGVPADAVHQMLEVTPRRLLTGQSSADSSRSEATS